EAARRDDHVATRSADRRDTPASRTVPRRLPVGIPPPIAIHRRTSAVPAARTRHEALAYPGADDQPACSPDHAGAGHRRAHPVQDPTGEVGGTATVASMNRGIPAAAAREPDMAEHGERRAVRVVPA